MKFHIDYLKLTVFGVEPMAFQNFVNVHLLAFTPFDDPTMWEGKPIGGKIHNYIWSYGNGDCVILKARQGDFLQLQLKGRGCGVLQERLGDFFADLVDEGWRWHCTRVDGAWDPLPGDVTMEMILHAFQDGSLVSTLSRHSVEIRHNGDGGTIAFPEYAKRETAPRMVRFYDKRGPIRMEVELHKDDATAATKQLARVPQAEWALIMLGYLLRTIDFRDRASHSEVEKRTRLPWWESIVGDAKKSVG